MRALSRWCAPGETGVDLQRRRGPRATWWRRRRGRPRRSRRGPTPACPEHEIEAGLGDPRLLARDGLERRAQPVGVVERDARDRRGRGGRDHVGRVEPSPEADLDDGEVDLRVAKREEGRERRRLEERQSPGPRRGRGSSSPARASSVTRLAVDADALGEAAKVRRGVHARCGCPAARAIDSTIAQTLPLPLVPATCTARKARSGWPVRSQACRIGLEPQAHPERDARVLAGQGSGERGHGQADGPALSRPRGGRRRGRPGARGAWRGSASSRGG